ncbi:MAG: nucleotide exchange factor GrpE [Desulfococcaceae bacterium]
MAPESYALMLNDWKTEIEDNFREWMSEMEARGETSIPPEPAPSAPDLYSFYEALTALTGDIRKSSRRHHETLSRFTETLESIQSGMGELGRRLSAERTENTRRDQAERKKLLTPFAEMLERLNRMERKLAAPPQTGFWFGHSKWKTAWESFQQGFVLLREHFESLLKAEGIVAMETVGQEFDPTRMKAAAVENTDALPHNTVMEELSRGFFHHNEILKFAEVKIAIRKRSSE